MVRAILFDADGVLIDACELHFVALNRALATVGWNISRGEHLAFYNGLPTHRKLQILTERKGFPQEHHQLVHDLKQRFTVEAVDECLVFAPEKADLLRRVKAAGLKIGICSNSLRSSLDKMLTATALSSYPDVIVGNDDVEAPKPSPQMFLLAAKRLGVSIRECVIVEDSPVGLQAAYSAGPYFVIAVSGPEEVNAKLFSRIRRHVVASREAA